MAHQNTGMSPDHSAAGASTAPPPPDPPRPWLASYAPGVPADIAPVARTLPDALAASVAAHAGTTALDFMGARTTYAELAHAVDRAASALAAHGVRAGDRVALVLPNCPQHVVAFYAVLRLGAVVVEHNPLYTRDELEVQFTDHGARVAVVWGKIAHVVHDLGVPVVLSVDLSAALPWRQRALLRLPVPQARAAAAQIGPRRPAPGTVPWERAVARAQPLDPATPGPAPHDAALIQYTGGTTGVPRGAVLTHVNLLSNATQGQAWMPGMRPGEETILAVLPFFHAYGLTLCLTFSVLIGATLAMLPRFEAEQTLRTIARVRPTFLPGVPPIYDKLATLAPERGVDLTSLRYAISGAMALPPELVERWEALSGGLLIEGYGMTETSPITVGNPVSTARRPGTVGIPFPSTYVRIADRDDPTRDAVDGDPGELLVKGPQVFSGYWNRPEETAAVLLPGGWMRTGDVVVMDDAGFIRVVDRIKELVITGGFNVYPSEVETVLRQHPLVAESAVVGVPGPDAGEQVVAAVVRADGTTDPLDDAELKAFCRRHLAGYKVPRRFVVVTDLPRSMIGKVQRRQVRAMLMDDDV